MNKAISYFIKIVFFIDLFTPKIYWLIYYNGFSQAIEIEIRDIVNSLVTIYV